jgi:hypothetical protein
MNLIAHLNRDLFDAFASRERDLRMVAKCHRDSGVRKASLTCYIAKIHRTIRHDGSFGEIGELGSHATKARLSRTLFKPFL